MSRAIGRLAILLAVAWQTSGRAVLQEAAPTSAAASATRSSPADLLSVQSVPLAPSPSVFRSSTPGSDTATSPLEAARFEDSAWDDPLYTTSNSWIEVNYTQLVENARSLLPQIKPGSIPLAMVKGDGYGHGAVIAAKAFVEGGFRELGVGDLHEALALRRAGLAQPLHVCYQPDARAAPALAAAPDLQVYAEDAHFVSALCRAALARNWTAHPLPVHITVSTGAVREGVRGVEEVLALAREVRDCPALHLRGLATHHGKLEAFLPIVAAVRSNISQAVIAHMASSSSGFHDGQQYHLDLVRLGTALYSFDKEGSAARWLTRITGIKQAYAGDELGYDKTAITADMRIAVVDVGAVDGADDVTKVVVRGKVCPVVGYGGMNMHIIDISTVPNAEVGDLVLLGGCCADDGTFLPMWYPSVPESVMRVEVRGEEGVWAEERGVRRAQVVSESS